MKGNGSIFFFYLEKNIKKLSVKKKKKKKEMQIMSPVKQTTLKELYLKKKNKLQEDFLVLVIRFTILHCTTSQLTTDGHLHLCLISRDKSPSLKFLNQFWPV